MRETEKQTKRRAKSRRTARTRSNLPPPALRVRLEGGMSDSITTDGGASICAVGRCAHEPLAGRQPGAAPPRAVGRCGAARASRAGNHPLRVRAIGRSPAQPGVTTGRLTKLFPSLARPDGDEQSGNVSGIQVMCWKPPAQTGSERSGNVSGSQVVCRRCPCRRGDGSPAGKAVSIACPAGANEVATYRVVKSYAGSRTRMGATDPRLVKPSPSPGR